MDCFTSKNLKQETETHQASLYHAACCPCMNINCDLYMKCDECIKRHHSSSKYPLTACEICKAEGCKQVNPAKYFAEHIIKND